MSWLSKGLKKVENWVADKIPHTSAAEKRAAMQATKSQIDYYNQAKEELTQQRADTEEKKNEDSKRISEKQIRARQRTYRRAGFMSEPTGAPSDKLG